MYKTGLYSTIMQQLYLITRESAATHVQRYITDFVLCFWIKLMLLGHILSSYTKAGEFQIQKLFLCAAI